MEIDGEPVEIPFDCFVVAKSKNGRSLVIPLNAQAVNYPTSTE